MASPRKTAKPKETSGMLMSIIRTISTSADFEEREKEKARIEKAFRESDRKLDKLVTEHYEDLTSIIQAFSKISAQVTASQERVRNVKENLQSCKNLLHCKRDELKKLWIEGIEHRTMVNMLNQIEQVKDVTEKLQGFLQNKHYLHATDLLVSSVSLLEGDLAHVEALRDLRLELAAKKEDLHEVLIDELHKQVYIRSTSTVVKGFQRQGSTRKVKVIQSAPLPSPEEPERLDPAVWEKPQQITESLTSDPEADPGHFLAVLVESLFMLQKLPDAIEAIKSRIKPELMAIVQRASQQISDNAYLEGENVLTTHQPKYLLELLQLVFQQFRVVAQTHQVVLANFRRIVVSASGPNDLHLYDMVDVWSQIQAVLQILLSDYLDIRNTTAQNSHGSSVFDSPSTDINSYFMKKKPTKKKCALFRFEGSSHAISMNSYLREQRAEFYGSGEILSSNDNLSSVGQQQFVCQPGASNITVIYNPLKGFVKEIAAAIGCPPENCTLQVFLAEFVRDIYLGQVHYGLQNRIDAATKGFDALRTVIDQRTQRALEVPKPLLQSTVTVDRTVHELQELMQDLPDYSDQFLNMVCKIIVDYKETCNNAYRGIVLSESEEKRVISATWAKDEDIGRLLRCLPNWQTLHDQNTQPVKSEMAVADLQAFSSKESEILTSNLSSESLIPVQEILTDVAQLRTLANLCESLDWFSERLRGFAKSLPTNIEMSAVKENVQISPVVSEASVKPLLDLSEDLQELSEICLLVLHLEIRVHCFYYLMPVATQSNYSGAIDDMDPDSNVIKLNKDLSSIEEVMTQSLQHKKFRYLFEGLGHLVSTILINSAQFLKRINENGIKKMCRNIFAIQQNLTNITMSREADLDHARQYYELLYLTADDILRLVMEQGSQFTELEYINIIHLLHRSRPGADQKVLEARLQRLKEILRESLV